MATDKKLVASIVDLEKKLNELKKEATKHGGIFKKEIGDIELQLEAQKDAHYDNLSPWDRVQIARDKNRPVLVDYLHTVFTDFTELHGDRRFSDDQALVGGFAKLNGKSVMVIGHNKGKNLEENIERRFGLPFPDGYRKALRLMELAQRFNTPIITFIDTQGAYPGLEGEERGQAEAIARNLVEMFNITVPIVCVVLGEGGSGGALGIGVGDRTLMLSNAWYSVISPEGCAAILWRDGAKAPEAAAALKVTAPSLVELKIVDRILEEPNGGAHLDYENMISVVKSALIEEVAELSKLSATKLRKLRHEKYAKIGMFNE